MSTLTPRIDFGDGWTPHERFVLYEKIISDRGSRYSVSIGYVTGKADIKAFLATLTSKKAYAKATHHSWATRLIKDGAVYETKRDDGETGAGMVILRELQAAGAVNCIVCVTRWFGGTKLMGDRFKHLQDASRYALKVVPRTPHTSEDGHN